MATVNRKCVNHYVYLTLYDDTNIYNTHVVDITIESEAWDKWRLATRVW